MKQNIIVQFVYNNIKNAKNTYIFVNSKHGFYFYFFSKKKVVL